MSKKLAIAMFGQKRLSREGGVEIVVKELCTRMAQNGCDVTCYNRAGHHVSGAEYDDVNGFVNDLINDKFAIYLSGDINHMVAANDDRAVATYFAVENCGTFGVGIGAVAMNSTNAQVKYLGLNSASSYIYMIGVVGYFLWTLCLARIGIHSDKGTLRKTVLYFLYLLLLSYFLPIFSAIALLPAIWFIFYIFELEQSQKGSEYK